jgi:hypothetical protein
MDPITVTLSGVKDATGLGATTINALLKSGQLTRIKVGGRTLVTVESIARFVEQKVAASEAQGER